MISTSPTFARGFNSPFPDDSRKPAPICIRNRGTDGDGGREGVG